MAAKTGKTTKASAPAASTSDDKPIYQNFGDQVAKEAGGKAYNEWQSAKELEDRKRIAFEEAFIAEIRKRGHITEDQSLNFSYRFGMAFTIVDKKDRKEGGRKRNEFTL